MCCQRASTLTEFNLAETQNMSGFTLQFVDVPYSHRAYCLLCKLPMQKPVEIKPCGHHFCDVCLQEFLSGGIFKCPEDELPLDYAQIFPDTEIQSEIMNCRIRCKFYKDGCKWIDKLQGLQEHLETCRFNATVCPNNCQSQLSHISMDDHLEFICPKRKVVCEYCNLEYTGEYMDQHHSGNCPSEVIWCENKCGAKLERKFLSNHMKNECHKRTVQCMYCNRDFVEETLQTHQYQCSRLYVTCPNRCEPGKIPREDINIHVTEKCPSITVSCPFKEAGCNHKCPKQALDKHLEESTKDHLELMMRYSIKQNQVIDRLQNSLKLTTQVTDGTFVWKISNYKSKLIDAVYKTNQELISEPFYSSRYGYKMVASIFPNGNGLGEGKYLSVYIKILPGEYDNIVDWPFMLPISFTVFDQNNDPELRCSIKESFVPDPSWKHFQKPSEHEESLGFGYPKFISHDILKTRDYIKDDCLVLKVDIKSSNHILP